jgi:guanosine-3',5'-bis(diphosphate) 3'-pyrophosphohydrolase
MHEIAERGVAAHAIYKDAAGRQGGAGRVPRTGCRIQRLSLAAASDGDACRRVTSPREFLEHTKLELFHDQVFCFTPKGKLIALPKGATPIDFAYAVHTVGGRQLCRLPSMNGRTLRW